MKLRLLPLLLVVVLLLAACGENTGGPQNPTEPGGQPGASATEPFGGEDPEENATPAQPAATQPTPAAQATGTAGPTEQLNIALLVNGTLGDKGFFDSANAGVQRAEEELGANVRVVEVPEQTNWEPTLRQLSQGEYDLIVVGTFDMIDAMNAVAPQFPDQKYIFYDAVADQPNVANITYAQNEGSFLAGVLAACIASSEEVENTSGDNTIGVVGGTDIPVINDFIVGYEQGAKYVNPDVEVLKSYAGTFEDPAKGKTLAAAQFQQGANVVFNVAGKTGLGVLEAADEADRYAIGVDANQNALYPGKVLSSMLKRVDNSVFDLIQMEAQGSLQTGKTYVYGIQNQGVGLAEDQLYIEHVPQECRDQVDKAKQDIASGRVEVQSAFE